MNEIEYQHEDDFLELKKKYAELEKKYKILEGNYDEMLKSFYKLYHSRKGKSCKSTKS